MIGVGPLRARQFLPRSFDPRTRRHALSPFRLAQGDSEPVEGARATSSVRSVRACPPKQRRCSTLRRWVAHPLRSFAALVRRRGILPPRVGPIPRVPRSMEAWRPFVRQLPLVWPPGADTRSWYFVWLTSMLVFFVTAFLACRRRQY